MKLLSTSTALATLLFSTCTLGNPLPQFTAPCILLPVPRTSYPEARLVTSNPANSTVDNRYVYLPSRIGIPESPPPAPLVIYGSKTAIPTDTSIFKGTLQTTALYTQYFSAPAKTADYTTPAGLSSVFFQSAGTMSPIKRAVRTGSFKVVQGCDGTGRARQEFWPTEGKFCVRSGWKPELELLIKTAAYVEVKNDPNPCTDVVLVVQVTGNTVSPGGL